MDSAEIVPSHVESDGSFVVLDFLAVSVGGTGEPAKVHPQAQVPAFDIAGRDVIGVRHSMDVARDLFEDFAGAIPVRASAGGVLEYFDELGIVSAGPEQVFNGLAVSAVAIGGELEIAMNTISQLGNELVGIARAPLAGVEGNNQLGIRVQRNPQVGVAPFVGIVLAEPGLFGVAKAPNLVGLDALGSDGLDAGVEHGLRFLSGTNHQSHNCVLVDVQSAGDGADAHSLKHEGKDLGSTVNVGVVASQRLGGGVGKGGFARVAAVALDFALSVGAKLVGGIVLAADAGHGVFPLALSGEKRHTIYGSRLWVTPQFGLAPRPVRAGSGALIEGMLSRWLNGYFYRLTVLRAADCDDDAHDGVLLSRASRCVKDTGRSYLEPKLISLGYRSGPNLGRRRQASFSGRLRKSPISGHSGQTARRGRVDDHFVWLGGIGKGLDSVCYRLAQLNQRRKIPILLRPAAPAYPLVLGRPRIRFEAWNHVSGINHPSDSRCYGCHRSFVLIQRKSKLPKPVHYLGGVHPLFARCAKNTPARLSETSQVKIRDRREGVGFVAQLRKQRDLSFGAGNLDLQLFLLYKHFGESLHCQSQIAGVLITGTHHTQERIRYV